MAEATECGPELSLLFVKWLRDGVLLIDSDELIRHDPVTKSLHVQWERFKSKEGVLYRTYWKRNKEAECWQLVLPGKYRVEIMNTAHSSVTGGHMGVKKTQVKVAKKAYWVGWARDVRDFCRRCDACAVSPWCSDKSRRVAEHVRRSSVGACRDRRDRATPTVEQGK